MKKKVLLMSNAREASTRCPHKMIRRFGDTTLTDILLEKLETIIKREIFDDCIFAINKKDKKLWDIASSYNVRIQERSDFSAKYGKLLSDIHHYLDKYDQDYIFWVNGSLPLLKKQSIINAGKYFIDKEELRGLHPIKRRFNWFWMNNEPVNIHDKSHTRTQDSGEIYESVHAFHIFERKYMLKNNAYWDFTENNPYLYKVDDSIEFLDINTKKDFKVGKILYEKYED